MEKKDVALRLARLREKKGVSARDMSLSIYCIHPMVCKLCQHLSVPSGIPYWMTVTAVSVAMAYLWTFRTRLHQKRRL